MQTRTKQRQILDGAADLGELPLLCWYAASNAAGKETTIALANHTLPIVPVVPWPALGGHREQSELTRLLAELMCKSMRRHLQTTREIAPALSMFEALHAQGIAWEEWQLEEIEMDQVCPHCGAVNAPVCCADWQPKRKPKRKGMICQ